MHLIDFFLNNKFTVEENSGTETKEGTIKDFKKSFNDNEILAMAQNYKGNHYRFIINLAIKNGNFDLVLDLALLNHDYNLCKTVYAKIEEAKYNKVVTGADQIKTEADLIVKQMRNEVEKLQKDQINKSKENQIRNEFENFKKQMDKENQNNIMNDMNLLNGDMLGSLLMNIFFPFDFGKDFFHDEDDENKRRK